MRSRRAGFGSGEEKSGEDAKVRVGLPAGPGSDLPVPAIGPRVGRDLVSAWNVLLRVRALKSSCATMLPAILRRAGNLNQFHCSLRVGLCSPEADALVRQSLEERVSGTVRGKNWLAEAHAELVAREVYIPLGAPVRWSLCVVRSAITAPINGVFTPCSPRCPSPPHQSGKDCCN